MASFADEKQENLDEPDAGQLWGKRWKNKVMPYDLDEEGTLLDNYLKECQILGPRTAGDGSDNPDEPSPMPHLTSTPALQSGASKRERSEAVFKRHPDVQSSTSQDQMPLGHSVDQPMPDSKSVEGITSATPTGKFQFKPQKILEAAKRIGQGSKSGLMEGLDTLPNEKEKKRGALKKLLKESSFPVLGGNSRKQKAVAVSTEEAPAPLTQLLRPEEPSAFSEVDQPSNFDLRSFPEEPPSGSDLQCPLSDAILALLCELLKDRDSWLTIDRVQQGFAATLGGLLEW